MTNEELNIQAKTINRKIKMLRSALEELKNKESLSVDELREEAKIRREISFLKNEKQILMETETEDNKVELSEEVKSEKSRKGSNAVLYACASFALICSIIALTLNCSKGKKNSNYNAASSVIITTSKPTEALPTPTLMVTPTPEVEVLFSDVDNEEELIERAKLIYDIDLKPILEAYGNEQVNNVASNENLIDIIRVSLGELPIYSEYNNNTVNEIIGDRTDIYGNLGSKPSLNKIYPVHYSYLAPDNSEISEYMETYDELYNNIADARNNKDVEKTISNIKVLAIKQYNEWVLGGLYGSFDPYLFDTELHALALGASVERYESYVLEFIDSNRLTICVPVCIDYETGETKEVNVIDIYEAILLGKSKNGKVYMSYFGDEQIVKISKVFNKELKETLEYKNDKVLKRG